MNLIKIPKKMVSKKKPEDLDQEKGVGNRSVCLGN